MSLSQHPVHFEFQEKGGTLETEARHKELSALLEHPNSPIVLSMGGKEVIEKGKLFRTPLISEVVV